jgi:hypothetical protein
MGDEINSSIDDLLPRNADQMDRHFLFIRNFFLYCYPMNLTTFITRLDEESLQILIGRSAITLLNSMNTDLARLTKLQAVLLNIYSPYELLKQKESRNILFDLLKKEEADQLSTVFNNGSAVPDSYAYIKNFRFRTDSQFEQLYAFFELPARAGRDNGAFKGTRGKMPIPAFSTPAASFKRIRSTLVFGRKASTITHAHRCGKNSNRHECNLQPFQTP